MLNCADKEQIKMGVPLNKHIEWIGKAAKIMGDLQDSYVELCGKLKWVSR